jgi:3-methyladenine DNA glycosylase AlkC
MCIDQGLLLEQLLPDLAHRADELRVGGFITKMRTGGSILFDRFGTAVFDAAPMHSSLRLPPPRAWGSDIVRGWAAFAVGLTGCAVEEQLNIALSFARDTHFAVREFAWLGVRDAVSAEPARAVTHLAKHVGDPSPWTRRFCSEATRPRGVWSRHIPALKRSPQIALPVLDPLSTAPEKYVTDSVGNWLNDVAMTNPVWVEETCERWARWHGTSAEAVIRRARRNFPSR